MPKYIACPYYLYDSTSKQSETHYVACEFGSRKIFGCRSELLEYRNRICGDVGSYSQCEIAKQLTAYYEMEGDPMSAKISNRDRVKQLEKEVDRWKYLANAKNKEVVDSKKWLADQIAIEQAKLDSAMRVIAVLMSHIGTEVEISKEALKESDPKLVKIDVGDLVYRINVRREKP